jgi:hypothetical protein
MLEHVADEHHQAIDALATIDGLCRHE